MVPVKALLTCLCDPQTHADEAIMALKKADSEGGLSGRWYTLLDLICKRRA